ncbi:hypothetical protein T4B_15573 [Trichinella pseudospiralis]|uniref:Uncharacterized protein n=1 Tax=Trichinella pseudospiralis TaxID=6337 RepID=A0A0V1JLW7_TRIPS|nr:hypothetical protein T4B_15573 [Trichinella pseudospiralis]KRZ35950.1 hypothetical protein T4C_9835 [Trichinella pseudospiralis]
MKFSLRFTNTVIFSCLGIFMPDIGRKGFVVSKKKLEVWKRVDTGKYLSQLTSVEKLCVTHGYLE